MSRPVGVLAFWLTVLLATAANATPCVDFSNHFNWLNTFDGGDGRWFNSYVSTGPSIWALSYDGDLYVFDVSDPAQPTQVAFHDLGGLGKGLYGNGNPYLLSRADSTMWALDLSDPYQWVVTDTLVINTPVYDLAFADSMAYMANGAGGLHILDLTDPTNIATAGDWRPSCFTTAVTVSGGQAYAVCASQLYTLDLSDPLQPAAIDSMPVTVTRVFADGDHLILPGQFSGFALYDLVAGQGPVWRADIIDSEIPRSLAVSGDLMAVAFPSALVFYDLASGTVPNELASFNYPAYMTDARMIISGNVLFHAGNWGITVLDLGDGTPATATEPMLFPGGWPGGMAARDEFVLAAAADSGVVVYDVSDPATPFITNTIPTSNSATDVCLSGDLAYVVGVNLFSVMDISVPALPIPVGSIAAFPYSGNAISHVGNIIWGADGNGVWGVDITAPMAPTLQYWLPLPGLKTAVAQGDFLHTLDTYGNYSIYDLTHGQPQFVATLGTGGLGICLAVQGDLVLSGDIDGIWFIDVSTPEAPQILHHYLMPTTVESISLHGHYAVVSAYRGGLITLDITDPLAPRSIDTKPGTSTGHVVLASGAVMSWGRTFKPYEGWANRTEVVPPMCRLLAPAIHQMPAVGIRLNAVPNPFNPRTRLSFELPDSGPCRLVIVDAAGRVVTTLCDDTLPKGTQDFSWDGRDAAGRGLGSGVYFARLGYRGGSTTRKITLVR